MNKPDQDALMTIHQCAADIQRIALMLANADVASDDRKSAIILRAESILRKARDL